MTHRALLFCLLLALPLRAEETTSEVVDDKALEADFRELSGRYEQAKKGTISRGDLIQYYRDRAQAKGTPRQRAIAAYFYGFVLNMAENPKDGKREIERAIQICPKLLPAYAELAMAAERTGDRAEAERQLARAIELVPENVRMRVLLAHFVQRRGDLERAKELYEKCLEPEPDLEAIAGLITVNTRLFQTSFDEKAREQYAREALDLADAIVTLQPNDPRVRVSKAQVFLELGKVDEARDYLEGLYAEGTLKPEIEIELLKRLRAVYQAQGSVEGVRSSIDRLLKSKGLRAEERARLGSKLKDLESMKSWAFMKWDMEEAIQILKNPGLSVEHRTAVLRRLIGFCNSEAVANDTLRPLVEQAFEECFRVLTDPQPELVVTQLRFLRSLGAQPRLMSVLVHFVYPKGASEEVREEGCRSVAVHGGAAAIPALYYSLQDGSGRVVREADAQLAVLCERRSPFGGGIDPLTPEQIKQARGMWTEYFHSEEGSARLAKAFETLAGCVVRVNPALTAAPMIDHAANVLLDGDVQWAGWSASYAFLVSYWGKDFRPVDRRGKQVEPSERQTITEAFETEFNPEAAPQPPAKSAPANAKPGGAAGMKKGK